MDNICIFMLDLILNPMCSKMSFSNCFFPIDQEMQLNNSIESALSHQTETNILDIWIFQDQFTNRKFHIKIMSLIEKLTNGWPTNMIYVVSHKS